MKKFFALALVIGVAWGIYYQQTGGGNMFDLITKPGGKSAEEHIENAQVVADDYGDATQRRIDAEFGSSKDEKDDSDKSEWAVQRD